MIPTVRRCTVSWAWFVPSIFPSPFASRSSMAHGILLYLAPQMMVKSWGNRQSHGRLVCGIEHQAAPFVVSGSLRKCGGFFCGPPVSVGKHSRTLDGWRLLEQLLMVEWIPIPSTNQWLNGMEIGPWRGTPVICFAGCSRWPVDADWTHQNGDKKKDYTRRHHK